MQWSRIGMSLLSVIFLCHLASAQEIFALLRLESQLSEISEGDKLKKYLDESGVGQIFERINSFKGYYEKLVAFLKNPPEGETDKREVEKLLIFLGKSGGKYGSNLKELLAFLESGKGVYGKIVNMIEVLGGLEGQSLEDNYYLQAKKGKIKKTDFFKEILSEIKVQDPRKGANYSLAGEGIFDQNGNLISAKLAQFTTKAQGELETLQKILNEIWSDLSPAEEH